MNRFILFCLLLLPFWNGVALADHHSDAIPLAQNSSPRLKSHTWMSLADWYSLHAEDVALAEKGDAPLLFIGDSITQGWNGNGQSAWDKHFGLRGAVNFGIGGDQTQNLVWRLRHGATSNLSPRAIVLLIGTNNFGFNPDEAPIHVAAGVAQVVDQLHASFPKADILLMAVFPRNREADHANRGKIAKLNTAIAPLGHRDYVTFMDINTKLLKPDGTLSKDVMYDYLHLTEQGYQIWAEAILPWVAARVDLP